MKPCENCGKCCCGSPDDIILPEDAQAFQFPDTEKYGWMPELVGGEWIKEDEE